MIELVRTFVERLLSWPIAIFLLCLIFKKPLESFLARIVLLKAPGVELSAPARAEQQLIEVKTSITEDQLAKPLVAQQNLPIPEDLAKRQKAARDFGSQVPIVPEQIEIIRGQLKELQFPLESADTSELLIRHLAVTQLLARFEGTYRMIFGSQIGLLQLLNQSGPQTLDTARSIFERAKSVSPQFYGDYSLEQWIGFLVKQGALLSKDDALNITVYGAQFLEWMVAAKAPQKPH